VAQNIAGNIRVWNDTELLYNQAIALHKKNLVTCKGNEVHIPVLKLAKAKPLATVAYEIIREYGFSPAQTGELVKLLDSSSGSYIQSHSHQILKNRAWLIISPLDESEQALILVHEGEQTKLFNTHRLDLKPFPPGAAMATKNPNVEMIDAKELRYPLLLRKWKAGDYFYPLGMPKKKKLARFFIDQKLSILDKENVWVLESDKRIIWVIGYRLDHRFRITDTTTHAARLSIRPPGTGEQHQ
jgi:tRNA(Ile)-lysidine synthase